MKKAIFSLLTLCIAVNNISGQDALDTYSKKVRFGFNLQSSFNMLGYSINDGFEYNNSKVNSISHVNKPGFGLGIIMQQQVHKNISMNLQGFLEFSDNQLSFEFDNSTEENVLLESSNIGILLQGLIHVFSSSKPGILIGTGVKYNLQQLDNDLFYTKPFSTAIEIGLAFQKDLIKNKGIIIMPQIKYAIAQSYTEGILQNSFTNFFTHQLTLSFSFL